MHTWLSPLTHALHVTFISSPPLGQCSNIYSKIEIRNINIMSIFLSPFFYSNLNTNINYRNDYVIKINKLRHSLNRHEHCMGR